MSAQEITRDRLADLSKRPQNHKYDHGHAVVVSGIQGKTGASRLAARAALRVGAGLVTLATPMPALAEAAAHVTSVMLHPLDGAPGLTELLEDKRLNALCLGPGLGLGTITHHLVIAALRAERATVLDADALSRFERKPEVLFDLLHDRAVLTPHGGEFARLFPDLAAQAGTDPGLDAKIAATQEAAARSGCTILFKGPQSVIAGPTGEVLWHDATGARAAPWLATAGAGDVLAGLITGLMARGIGPMDAAATAVWLHVETARTVGPGLIAEDLPDALPAVFSALQIG